MTREELEQRLEFAMNDVWAWRQDLSAATTKEERWLARQELGAAKEELARCKAALLSQDATPTGEGE